jgi:hypothetical protein
VGDAKLIESAYPRFEFLPIGTAERNMVEAGPELAELLVGYRRHVLVQPEELAIADQVTAGVTLFGTRRHQMTSDGRFTWSEQLPGEHVVTHR